MVQPINYLQNVQDPFAQAVQGLQLGTGIANIYAQREADEQKRVQQALAQAEQQRYQTGINTYFATPSAERKYEDLERLFIGANKQQFDALQAVGKTMTDEKLASAKRFTGQVLSALESNPETAKQLLTQRAEAETDPMQKKAWQDTLKLAEVSPEQAIKSVELIGGASFGKDWYESISNVRKSRREEALVPAALKQADIKTQSEMADLRFKLQNEPDKAKQLALETQIKELELEQAQVKTKYAEREASAGLGLTGAQTAQANAAAAKFKKDLEDGGVKVQSSNILPNGTVVFVTTNGKTRVVGPDGVELTGQERVDAVRDAEQFGADIQQLRSGARKAGEIGQTEAAKAFESVGKIRRNISNLDSAIAALDAGATTGVIASKFPNWRASTIELQNVQRQLGLDIIGSVTFGALSEGELSLALETALPLNMNEPQLKDWLIRKKTAQNKLADYITEQARFLSIPGRSLGDWLIQAEKRGEPPGMTAPGTGAAGAAAAATPATPAAAPTAANTVTVNGKTYTRPANFTDVQWNAYKQAMGVR